MARTHRYVATVEWTGNDGAGTAGYAAYRRDHVIRVAGKPDLLGSSDPAFRGDAGRYTPEDLLVAALSVCHMLWYLHLCAVNGVAVSEYTDTAEGTMEEDGANGGRFLEAVLRPRVRISAGDRERAIALHAEAHARCFIANSVNFPVRLAPSVEAARGDRAPG